MIQDFLCGLGVMFSAAYLAYGLKVAKYYIVHRKIPMDEKDLLIANLSDKVKNLEKQLQKKEESLEKLQNLIADTLK